MKEEHVQSLVERVATSIGTSLRVASRDAYGFNLIYLQSVSPLLLLIARLHFSSIKSTEAQQRILANTLHVIKVAYED